MKKSKKELKRFLIEGSGAVLTDFITYYLMLNFLSHNIAKTISFLFVGEFKNYSISWSQANVEEYEKEFTPRHLLEWNVIKFYKDLGFTIIGSTFIEADIVHAKMVYKTVL